MDAAVRVISAILGAVAVTGAAILVARSSSFQLLMSRGRVSSEFPLQDGPRRFRAWRSIRSRRFAVVSVLLSVAVITIAFALDAANLSARLALVAFFGVPTVMTVYATGMQVRFDRSVELELRIRRKAEAHRVDTVATAAPKGNDRTD